MKEARSKTKCAAILQTSATSTATLLIGSVTRLFSVFMDGLTCAFWNFTLQARDPLAIGVVVPEPI